ncbi:MAG: hypothetical protein P8X91_10340 [Candidatus Bathyarchaeota archaeon]
MGPSLPALPPELMVTDEARIFKKATCFLILPPLRATTSMTSGTPSPLVSGANFIIIGPIINPPKTGGLCKTS